MKILILHGYTQNGDIFETKLRQLTARIVYEFPETAFHWPFAPLGLRVDNVADLLPRLSTGMGDLDLRAWFDLRDTQDPPNGFLDSPDLLAEVLEKHDPFDGIIAFSQGSVVAAFLTSFLQGPIRHAAFLAAKRETLNVTAYSESFRKLQHPPLRFALLCASRLIQGPYYGWLYEKPPLETPFCLVNGRLNPMVDYGDRDAVPERLSGRYRPTVIVHPGTHHMPNDEGSLADIIRLMRKHVPADCGLSDCSAWEVVDDSSDNLEDSGRGRLFLLQSTED